MVDEYPDDKYWPVVLSFAKKSGFIIKADEGTAMLATHKVQIEQYGVEGHDKIQKMNKK